MIRLSALVCAHNQEAQLDECLRKLSFCDEVVVVADRCTDRSQEIARRHGAVVIDGIFPLEGQRRQAGVEACSGDWILEVEPEERIDAALAWEIRAVLQLRPAGDWYVLPIDNYVGETRVREGWNGGLSSRAEPRLYKRGLKAWEPRRVNSSCVLAGQTGGSLKGPIRRLLGRDVGGLVDRLNRLSALAAEDAADAARLHGFAGSLVRGAAGFLEGYVVCGGWREGRLGLVSAMLNGLFPVLTQMRAVEVVHAREAALAQPERPATVREVVGLAR